MKPQCVRLKVQELENQSGRFSSPFFFFNKSSHAPEEQRNSDLKILAFFTREYYRTWLEEKANNQSITYTQADSEKVIDDVWLFLYGQNFLQTRLEEFFFNPVPKSDMYSLTCENWEVFFLRAKKNMCFSYIQRIHVTFWDGIFQLSL